MNHPETKEKECTLFYSSSRRKANLGGVSALKYVSVERPLALPSLVVGKWANMAWFVAAYQLQYGT